MTDSGNFESHFGCDAWEKWLIVAAGSSVLGIVSGDEYTIQNDAWNYFLATNQDGALVGATNPSYWVITKESDDQYSIRDSSNRQHLQMTNEFKAATSLNNLSWERWRLQKRGNGKWCIESNEFRGHFLKMDHQNLMSHTGCYDWESWRIVKASYSTPSIVSGQKYLIENA